MTDGAATVGESVSIQVTAVNLPPVFAPVADLTGLEGETLAFTVSAGDPNGDALTYFIMNGTLPAGADFDTDSGRFFWTPSFTQSGARVVTFGVRDLQGLTATLDVSINILNVNRPPVLADVAGRVALVGQPFAFTVPGIDPDVQDAGLLTFAATPLPAGATFNTATGLFEWTPLASQVGTYHVQFAVFDPAGKVDRMTVQLTVSAVPLAPTASIQLTPSFPAIPGQAVTIAVLAEGASDIATISLTVNGIAQTLDALRRTTFTPTAPGHYALVATVTDVDGRVTVAQGDLRVRDAADSAAPVVSFTMPPAGAILAAATDVIASVTDTNLDNWQLELVAAGSGRTVALARGLTSFASATLATLNPDALSNGAYLLRLKAIDITGRETVAVRRIEIDTATKPAAFVRVETDLSASLNGVTIPVVRIYDSLQADANGVLGIGWRLPLLDSGVTTNVLFTGREADGVFSPFADATRLYLTAPDGTGLRFDFDPVAVALGGVTAYRPAWTSFNAAYTLTSTDRLLQFVSGGYYDLSTGAPYNPADLTLSFNGIGYHFARAPNGTSFALAEIRTPGGDRLVASDSGLVSVQSGDRLSFAHDLAGRLIEVSGPSGAQVRYQYDANGRLAGVDVSGGRTTFAYDARGLLTAAMTASGGVAVNYDGAGLLIAAVPLAGSLGTLRDFVGQNRVITTAAGGTDYFAFVLGERELAGAASGTVTLRVDVTGGATPGVRLFTFTEAGLQRFDLASGNYSFVATIAGDLNGDLAVNGLDSAMLPADVDGNGVVNATDTALLNADFGFVANRAPTAAAGVADTVKGFGVDVNLAPLASDLDGDALTFTILNVTNGRVVLVPGSRVATFFPASGYTGGATFTFAATDGLATSAPATVTITVADAVATSLEITPRDPVLAVGVNTAIELRVTFTGGRTFVVPVGLANFISLDPGVAAVTTSGVLMGQSAGTTAVRVQAFGLTAATAVTVGPAVEQNLDIFPLAYTLAPGETRQFLVRERVLNTIQDLSGAAAGTLYFVSDPTLGAITTDGLFTPLANGRVSVTVVHNGFSVVVPLLITAAQTGTVNVTSRGALLSDGGVTVGIPEGALTQSTAITVNSLSASDLTYGLPVGLQFAGGVEVQGFNDLTNFVPFSVAMPAPVGLAVGTVVPLLAPITANNADGTTVETWLLIDTMVVGADGFMRTTSPPNLGLASRTWAGSLNLGLNYTQGLRAYGAYGGGGVPGLLFAISDFSQSLNTLFGQKLLQTGDATKEAPKGQAKAQADPGVVELRIAGGPDLGSQSVRAIPGLLGDIYVPLVGAIDYVMRFHTAGNNGLVPSGEKTVFVKPNTITEVGIGQAFRLDLLTDQTIAPPVVTSGTFGVTAGGQRELTLKGNNFLLRSPWLLAPDRELGHDLADLTVTFEIGGRDTFDTNGAPLIVGGRDVQVAGNLLRIEPNTGDDAASAPFKLIVPVPNGVSLADAFVTVTRPTQEPFDGKFKARDFTSNPLRIVPQSIYAFAANGGDNSVSVIRPPIQVAPNSTQTTLTDEIARIPLGVGLSLPNLGARQTITTANGARVYVTLESVGGVAVVDAVGLQQVDLDVTLAGVQHIVLPTGAHPFKGAITPDGSLLYITDSLTPTVYVIDVDPFSTTYNKLLRTVTFDREVAPLGLTGIAISPDGKRVFVGAPARTIFGQFAGTNGSVIVFQRDSGVKDKPLEYQVIAVGPDPYDLVATDDNNVILVTDRLSQTQGVGVVRRSVAKVNDKDVALYRTDYVDLTEFGIIRRFIEGRATQVFGVTNVQGITYVPANSFSSVPIRKDSQNKDVLFGDHPGYAIITGFNKFVAGDPLHDPVFAPIYAWNPYFVNEDPGRGPVGSIGVQLGAGGNIGFVRNPVGDFSEPLEKPRLVAATSTVINGFPDNAAISLTSGQVYVGFQGINKVFVYDGFGIIKTIEEAAKSPPLASFVQAPAEPDPVAYNLMSGLLRGPLSTVPVDAVNPGVIVRAQFGFYSVEKVSDIILDKDGKPVLDKDGQPQKEVVGAYFLYGVPPTGPDGQSPNKIGPIGVGRLPRGLSVQPKLRGDYLALVSTPLNQSPTLNSFPTPPLAVEAGKSSEVELHSGAYQEEHALVTYQSVGQPNGLVLHYDSLRADPRMIYYAAFSGLQESIKDRNTDNFRVLARVTARLGDDIIRVKGLDADEAVKVGLQGNELFFTIPKDLNEKLTYGAGIPIDFTDAKSGVYTLVVEYGLFELRDGKYQGRWFTQNQPMAVVSSKDGMFGDGWGLNGYWKIIPGDGSVLLVDGNGTEQIFLAPDDKTQPWTSPTLDYSELKVNSDGVFQRRTLDGTVYLFDAKGNLSKVTDRNGNVVTYEYDGEKLMKITDAAKPVGLETKFTWVGKHVTKITDPDGRETLFEYDGTRLTKITDPDKSFRTFLYENTKVLGQMTGQKLKRGNTPAGGNFPAETFTSTFSEKIDYDDWGRVKSGTRVDGKTFELKPAQVLLVADPKKLADAKKGVEVIALNEETKLPANVPPDLPGLEAFANSPSGKSLSSTAKAVYRDFRGREITYELDAFGFFLSSETKKDKEEGLKQFSKRTGNGLLTATVDKVGNVTLYEYDAFGNVVKITDYPDTVFAYDATGKATVTRSTDAAVKIFRYRADRFNQLEYEKDEVGREKFYEIDPDNGDILSVRIVDPNAPAGSPNEVITRFTYFANGLIKTMTDGESHKTTYGYDSFGRLTTTTHHDDTVLTYEYSNRTGNISAVIDESGNRVEMTYDRMNRLTQTSVEVRKPERGSDAFTTVTYTTIDKYDAQGNVVSHKNRNDALTLYKYDSLDRKIEQRDDASVLNLITHWGYEKDSLPTLGYTATILTGKFFSYTYVQNPRGYTVVEVLDEDFNKVASYDLLGRETLYTYDKANRLIKIKNPDGGIVEVKLDGRGRMVERKGTTVEVEKFVYDHVNRLTSQTVGNTTGFRASGDQTTLTTYNLFDKPAEVKDAEGHITRLTYDRAGNVRFTTEAAESPNPFVTEYRYDELNRLRFRIEAGRATWETRYYPNGQIRETVDPRGADYVTHFEYDQLNRLITTRNAEGFVRKRVVDGVGNVLEEIDPLDHGPRYEYDGVNRLIHSFDGENNETVYVYDKAGNLEIQRDPRSTAGHAIESKWIYDAGNRVIFFTDAENGITSYDYDLNDNVIFERNPRTFATEHLFDKSSRQVWMKNAKGKFTFYRYDQVGNVTGIAGPGGVGDDFYISYDMLNRRVAMVSAPASTDVRTDRIIYHPLGMIAEEVLASGSPEQRRTVYAYDDLRQLESKTVGAGKPEAAEWKYEFDVVGNLHTETDPRDDYFTTTYTYDKINRLITKKMPVGAPEIGGGYAEIHYVYDDADRLFTESDPRNDKWLTTYEYDNANRIRFIVDRDDKRWERQYDKAGNLIKLIDPRGPDYKTEFTYDGLNRRRTRIDAYDHVFKWEYDKNSNLIDTYDERPDMKSAHTNYKYDELDRKIEMTDALEFKWKYDYDDTNLLTTETDPRKYKTVYTYDGLNQLKKVVQDSGSVDPISGFPTTSTITTKYAYDKVGNLVSMIDPRGDDYWTTFKYDNLGRMILKQQNVVAPGQSAEVYETIYTYDKAGNLRTETDPRGNGYTTTYLYDARNLVLSKSRPLDIGGPPATWTYRYNALGQIVAETDPRGSFYTVEYTYDKLGRLETKTQPTGTEAHPGEPAVETYHYDEVGNRIRVELARKPYDIVYTYDRLNRLETIRDAEANFTRLGYDEVGNLTSRIEYSNDPRTPQRLTTYDYDKRNRLRFMTNAEQMVAEYRYDQVGNLLEEIGPFRDANGVRTTTSRRYDALNRMFWERDTIGNVRRIGYDAAGNIAADQDFRGSFYTVLSVFDSLNRVVRVQQPTGTPTDSGPAAVSEYFYDGASNLIRTVDPRGPSFATDYEYDASNRLRVIRRVAGVPGGAPEIYTDRYGYDDAGNRISKEDARGPLFVTASEYDARNLLISRTVETGTPQTGNGSRRLTERYFYDLAGNLTEVQGMGGAAFNTIYDYNGINQRVYEKDAVGRETFVEFDRFGSVLTRTDEYGEASYLYDRIGRQTYAKNAAGEETRFHWFADTLVLEQRDGRGNPWLYAYDGLGRLVRTTDPIGKTVLTVYDAVGNVIQVFDQENNETESVYDARNLLIQRTEAKRSAVERTASWRYDLMGRLIEETPWRGPDFKITYVRDNLGRPIEIQRRTGTETLVEKRSYDAAGNLTRVIDPRGEPFETIYRYDGLNRVIRTERFVGTVAEPETAVESRTYDNQGRVDSVTDALGYTVKYSYDRIDRRKSMETKDEQGQVIRETWDYDDLPGGVQVTHRDARGTLADKTFRDEVGRVVRVESPESGVMTRSHDRAGNLETEANGPVSKTYKYNSRNLRSEVIDALGNRVTYTYDSRGNLETTTEARANGLPTTYIIDELNRVADVINPDASRVHYEYDDASNRTLVRDDNGNETTFEYDGLDRLITDSNAFGTRTYGYDGAGNTITTTDRNDRVINRAFDGRNLVRQEDWLDVAAGPVVKTIQYSYDLRGGLFSVARPEAAVTYTYTQDALHYLASETTDSVTALAPIVVNYDYARNGKLLSTALSIGSGSALVENTMVRDPVTDRLSAIVQTGSFVTPKRVDFIYERPDILRLGSVTRSVTAPGAVAVTSTFTYNSRGLVETLTHAGGGTTFEAYTFTYDDNGQLAQRVDRDGTATFGYDVTLQLASVTYTDPQYPAETYRYDGDGNREPTAGSPAYVTGPQNRLMSDGTFNYAYDNEGNLILKTTIATDATVTYRWDHHNRLVSVETRDGSAQLLQTVAYAYDGFDRRISVAVDTTPADGVAPAVRHLVYSGANVLMEFVDADGNGPAAPQADIAYLHGTGSDEVLAQENAAHRVLWLLVDQNNTTRDLVDANGTLVQHFKINAYGRIIDSGGSAPLTRYIFQGREFDAETGLYYFRARSYDPALGRFISTDPMGFTAGDANLYRFVKNNPANDRDPSGLESTSTQQSSTSSSSSGQSGGVWNSIKAGVNAVGNALGNAVGKGVDALSAGWAGFQRIAPTWLTNSVKFVGNTLAFGVGIVRGVVRGAAELLGAVYDIGQLATASVFAPESIRNVHTVSTIGTELKSFVGRSSGTGGQLLRLGGAVFGTIAVFAIAALIPWFAPAIVAVSILVGLKVAIVDGNPLEGGTIIGEVLDPALIVGKISKISAVAKARSFLGGKIINLFGKVREGGVTLLKRMSGAEESAEAVTKAFRSAAQEASAASASAAENVQPTNIERVGQRLDEALEVARAQKPSSAHHASEVFPDAEPNLVPGRDLGADLNRASRALEKLSPTFLRKFREVLSGGVKAFETDVAFIRRNVETYGQNLDEIKRLANGTDPELADKARKVLLLGNIEAQKTRDLFQAIQISKAIASTDNVPALLNKFGREGIYFSDPAPGNAIGFLLEELKALAPHISDLIGDFASLGTKGGTLDDLVEFRHLATYYEGLEAAAQERVYAALFSFNEGLAIKVDKAAKSGAFNPLSTDIDAIFLGLAEKIKKFGGFKAFSAEHPEFPKFVSNLEKFFTEAAGIEFDFAAWLKNEPDTFAQLAKEGFVELGAHFTTRFGQTTITGVGDLSQQAGTITGSARGRGAIDEVIRTVFAEYHRADPGTFNPVTSPHQVLVEPPGVNPFDGAVGSLHSSDVPGGTAQSLLTADVAVAFARLGASMWSGALGYPASISFGVAIADLPAGQLGYSRITEYSANGLPVRGEIVLDIDANGRGWFLDSTPWTPEEFAQSLTASAFSATSGAALGHYDLLTALSHEIGHLLGFTTQFGGFARNVVNRTDGTTTFSDAGASYTLAGGGNELDPAAYATSLMSATLGLSQRKLPGAIDGAILRAARGAAGAAGNGSVIVNFLHTATHLEPHGGFILLADATVEALQAGPVTGVQDGGFDQAGAPTWTQLGNVTIAGSAATLREDAARLFTDLSQVFGIPVGAQKVRVSISGLDLRTNPLNPPDAFEIALLDAITFEPLAGVAGLSGSDALLNVQPGGAFSASPRVTLFGSPASGAFDVEIDLAGLPANTPAALFFDLIRFGGTGSTVRIDGVTVVMDSDPTNVAPQVTGGATATITEGDSYTFSGTFSDADGADIWTGTIDFDNGQGPQPLALKNNTFSVAHKFLQDGPANVVVTIRDSFGAAGTAQWAINVENALPLIAPIATQTVPFGSTLTVSTTFTDPGADGHIASIDWGDGTAPSPAVVDPGTGSITGSHAYTNAGLFHAALVLSDDDGSTRVDFDVNVVLELTIATATGPAQINEGTVYRLDLGITGPDAATITSWTIDWGDGVVQTVAGTPSSVFHVFSGPGSRAIAASATNGVLTFTAGVAQVQVIDLPPDYGSFRVDGVVVEGGLATLSGTIIDFGDNVPHTLIIDWADGNTESFTLAPGVGRFSLTHIYENNLPGEAPYLVNALMTEGSFAPVLRTALIKVTNVPPTGNVTTPASGRAGDALRFFGGAFDAGRGDTLEVQWDFGDGTVLPFASTTTPGALSPLHAYGSAGTYNIVFRVRDSDGATGSVFAALAVTPGPVLPPGPTGGGILTTSDRNLLLGRSSSVLADAGFNTFDLGLHRSEALLLISGSERSVGLTTPLPLSFTVFNGLSLLDLGVFGTWRTLYHIPQPENQPDKQPEEDLLKVLFVDVAGSDGVLMIVLKLTARPAEPLDARNFLATVDGVQLETVSLEVKRMANGWAIVWKMNGPMRGSLRLQIDGLSGAGGQAFDGNGDGQPGGVFSYEGPIGNAEPKAVPIMRP